ncbi:MAG: VWA domain-containing protein, partial [bacterium]|nr:VWA domain-containing protein [bacterium]
KSAISSISINSGGTQYTNVADAVLEAITEFGSARHKSEAKKALVILTDGIPTYPEQAGNINHPSELALERGAEAKQLGIEIFTIGLGKDVDAEFLKSLASGENHYYTAPTSNDLTSVYGKVAESLCKIQAVRVEIIATIPPL